FCGVRFGGVERGVLLPALGPLGLDALRIIALVVGVRRGNSGVRAVAHTVRSLFANLHRKLPPNSPLFYTPHTEARSRRPHNRDIRGLHPTEFTSVPIGG